MIRHRPGFCSFPGGREHPTMLGARGITHAAKGILVESDHLIDVTCITRLQISA